MGEQRLPAVAVEFRQHVPQIAWIFGHLFVPGLVPRVDGLGGRGVCEPGRMPEQDALGLDFQARVEAVPVEQPQAQGVERRPQGDIWIVGDGLAQGQRAVRR